MAKGIFARMTDIIKSNINELLDRAEEPEKMIRQMVREMEEAVNKATASVGTAVANQKRLERQANEKDAQVEEWQRKAERAVEAGQDDLARRSLERKAVFAKAAEDLHPALEESRQTAEQLREQLRELKTKLEEARTRQGTLVARHRAAEARKRLAKSISGLGNDAFSSFERFEQKVESTEAEADAHTEVAGEMQSIEKEIRDLDQGVEIEDELTALKARLKAEEGK
ncbi:MAG: PspA/IM30 family protein [Gemmatimonadetes bacterium]|jgi:phage shock protein A|nr:PspA/IM30 family protein [Gemmatimonadota bacterium]